MNYQRILTYCIWGSITVWLNICNTCLDVKKQANLWLNR